MRLMLQINLVLEIMAHRNGCLWIVATFRSRSGCSSTQGERILFTPDSDVLHRCEEFHSLK